MAILSFHCCLFLIVIFTSQANADNNDQNFHYFCDHNNDRGNYTTNSTYHENLQIALLFDSFNPQIDYGFYNSSHGQNTDRVNAIGLCRGDVKPDDCRKCLNSSKANITQLCPNRKEAIGWYEDEKCMLRYSDRLIFGLNEIGPAYFGWNLHNATLADQFNQVVRQLLDSLRSAATSSDSRGRRKYAVGSVSGPSGNQTIYGLVQCTPDLSDPQCDNCLNQSIAEIPRCCGNSIGARIIRPSCNLRFETSFQFYQPTPPPPTSPRHSLAPPSSIDNK